MAKLTSYQKLKKELKEAKAETRRLEKAIYENDINVLTEVSSCYGLELEISKSLFFGNSQ